MLDFSPYRLVPTHPGAAIKPDAYRSVQFLLIPSTPLPGKNGKYNLSLSLSVKLTIRPADYSPFLNDEEDNMHICLDSCMM